MKLSHEVLLALAYVSQISDPDSVKLRFIESLNRLDAAFSFEFVEHLPPGVPEYRVLPITTLRSSFGYALIAGKPGDLRGRTRCFQNRLPIPGGHPRKQDTGAGPGIKKRIFVEGN